MAVPSSVDGEPEASSKLFIRSSDVDEAQRAKHVRDMRQYLSQHPEVWDNGNRSRKDSTEPSVPACCDDDDVLFRFALSRKFDVDAASRRYAKFCDAVREARVTDLYRLPKAADAVARTGCWFVPERTDRMGRPVLEVFVNRVDWTKFDVAAMKAACVYYAWLACTTDGYAAQETGIAAYFYLDGLSVSLVKREYCNFANALAQDALPMRVDACYVADPPFVVRALLWPIAKLALSNKIRDRVFWLNSKPDAAHPRAYQRLHEVLPPDLIPASNGGKLQFDPASEYARLLRPNERPSTRPASATTISDSRPAAFLGPLEHVPAHPSPFQHAVAS